jgi:hypothetical protein
MESTTSPPFGLRLTPRPQWQGINRPTLELLIRAATFVEDTCYKGDRGPPGAMLPLEGLGHPSLRPGVHPPGRGGAVLGVDVDDALVELRDVHTERRNRTDRRDRNEQEEERVLDQSLTCLVVPNARDGRHQLMEPATYHQLRSPFPSRGKRRPAASPDDCGGEPPVHLLKVGAKPAVRRRQSTRDDA